jgi:hypothetical protein
MIAEQPLRYPPNFPPTNKWDRFFLGVRWLGPDTSFFDQLRKQQASRTANDLGSWGDGDRHRMALLVGSVFASHLRWPTPFFLPDDDLAVISNGPDFGWGDRTDVDETVREIEEKLGVNLGDNFWFGSRHYTMSELIDGLISAVHR